MIYLPITIYIAISIYRGSTTGKFIYKHSKTAPSQTRLTKRCGVMLGKALSLSHSKLRDVFTAM